MKLKNTITGHIFETGVAEGKKLLDEFECFEIVKATKEEKTLLKKTVKTTLSIRERVMKKSEERQ